MHNGGAPGTDAVAGSRDPVQAARRLRRQEKAVGKEAARTRQQDKDGAVAPAMAAVAAASRVPAAAAAARAPAAAQLGRDEPTAATEEAFTVHKEPAYSGPDSVTLPVHIWGSTVYALFDSGATGVYMSDDLWRGFGRRDAELNRLQAAPVACANKGADIHVLGRVTIPVSLAGSVRRLQVAVTDRLQPGLIIGVKGMRQWRVALSFGANVTEVTADGPTEGVRNRWTIRGRLAISGMASALEQPGPVEIPAGCGANLWMRGPQQLPEGLLCEVALVGCKRTDVSVPTILARTVAHAGGVWLPVAVDNAGDGVAITLQPGDITAAFEPVDEVSEACAVIIEEAVAGLGEVPRGMEGGAPPEGNPPTSISPKHIRARIMETSTAGKEFVQRLATAVAEGFPEGFAEKAEELTQTTVLAHRIDTESERPVTLPARRIPPAMLDVQRAEADKFRSTGITRPSCSPYNAPVVMAPKKDGKLRFCVDYRALNKVTVKDCYPMPRIDESVDRLRGAKWFTTIDLCSGYHQVPLLEQHRAKTAFSVGGAHDEFNVMEFGLCNAPATFQRLMDLVLGGLKWTRVLVYIDDIIVFSRDEEQHIRDVCEVFTALQRANLRAKLSKCHFMRGEVEYLGHRVDAEGVRPTERNVKAVTELKAPQDVSGVRSFLGMAGYYRRHIEAFAARATLLTDLLKQETPWRWTEAHQAAFDDLRLALVKYPVLMYPDWRRGFVLRTDGAKVGLGAVLLQEAADGQMHPVAYASRATLPRERSYNPSQLECLAAVWAVEYFRVYLWGRAFDLIMDHAALGGLLSAPMELRGMTARWVMRLQPYSFRVIHRAGTDNKVADALSRMHMEGKQPIVHAEAGVAYTLGELAEAGDDAVLERVMVITPADWVVLQNKDPECTAVRTYLETGRALEGTDAAVIAAFAHKCMVRGGLLLFVDGGRGVAREKVWVPAPLRYDVLCEVHDDPLTGGHMGLKKAYERLTAAYFWPTATADLGKHITSCPTCARKAPPRPLDTLAAARAPAPGPGTPSGWTQRGRSRSRRGAAST